MPRKQPHLSPVYTPHKSRKLLRVPHGLNGVAMCLVLVAIVLYGVMVVIPHYRQDNTKPPRTWSQGTVVIAKPPAGKPYGLALGDSLPWEKPAQLNSELNNIAQSGATWIRIDMSWADIQPDSSSQFDWTNMDRVIASANQHHLHVLPVLAYTPGWARQSVCKTSPKCAPADDYQFADFVAAAVQRYAPKGLDSWEIWNEPNNFGFWQPSPSPAAYTALLKVSYEAIKHFQPESTVITGGLGPQDGSSSSISPPNFLAGMYASGAKPYFDAVGYHPYSFPAPPSYIIGWSGWSMMADIPDSMRAQMLANGDGNKKIWVTEFGAPTGGAHAEATPINDILIKNSDHVSEALQADMLNQAAESYRANGWMENFFWYTYQDLGTSTATNENFFGLLRYNGTAKPAYFAFEKAADTK